MKRKDLATTLREEAELFEREDEDDLAEGAWVRPKPPKEPSMVYSVRIPVGRVEELRLVAAAAGLEPSAMVRQWVLERLDAKRPGRQAAVSDLAGHLDQLLSAMSEGLRRPLALLVTPDVDAFRSAVVELRPARKAPAVAAPKGGAKQAEPVRAAKAAAKGATAERAAPRKATAAKATAKATGAQPRSRAARGE